MNMNSLGKGLVLVNLAFSVIFLTWALLLILNPVDWGWKEARKAYGGEPKGGNERIAARIDERIASYGRFALAKYDALARAKEAQAALVRVQPALGANHLFYNEKLDLLEKPLAKEAKSIDIKEVQYNKDGRVALEKNWPWGKPVLGVPVKADRPYPTYLSELEAKAKEVQDLTAEIDRLTDDKKTYTIKLNGTRADDGKMVESGYYQLQELETELQRKLRDELAYLQPVWVENLRNADLFRNRRADLEKRLRELGVEPSSLFQP